MSISLLRLKMIDLVRAGHIDQHEYSLFSKLTRASGLPSVPPMEFVDTDVTAPVFSFFEQQRAQGMPTGYERVGAVELGTKKPRYSW